MDKEATSEQKLNKTLAEKSSKQTSATNSAQCSSADAKEKEDESVAEKCKKFEADADHLDPISAGEYSNESSTSQSGLDCPVCLQSAAYPVRLPCQHVFCFLCIKGVTNRTRNCPMCRSVIPVDYFENPDVVSPPKLPESHSDSDSFQWFYEGRDGWWAYDERSNSELERSFQEGKEKIELLIAGHLYVIDFGHMHQHRRNEPRKRRQIKRDSISAAKKGIAGLKFSEEETVAEQLNSLNLN